MNFFVQAEEENQGHQNIHKNLILYNYDDACYG